MWVALQFSVDDPHYYSYEYVVEDVERSFVVRAYGDLDCDGVYSTFEMRGEIDSTMADGPRGNAPLTQTKPLE